MVGQNSNEQTPQSCITTQPCNTSVVYSMAPSAVSCQSSTGNTMCVPAGGLQVSDGKCSSMSVFPTAVGQVPMTILRADDSLYLDFAVLPLQLQSDYAQTDATKLDFIKNKPTIPLPFTCSDVKNCLGLTATTNGRMLLTNGVISYTSDVPVIPQTVYTGSLGVKRVLNDFQLDATSIPVGSIPSASISSIPATQITGLCSQVVSCMNGGAVPASGVYQVSISSTGVSTLTLPVAGGGVSYTAGTGINISSGNVISALSSTTTNTLGNNTNTLTSTVNGVVATAPVVNTVVNSLNGSNQLITTVNGVSSNALTLITPVSNPTGSLSTNTTGLTLNGGNSVANLLPVSTVINYNLSTAISALGNGSQGVLGGTGAGNSYIGADGQVHLLPVSPTSTGGTITGQALTTTTTGLSLGANASTALVNATSINYNLASGIVSLPTSLSSAITGTTTFVGGNGQVFTLPASSATQTQIQVVDSSTIDLTASGTDNHTITAIAKISTTAGNSLTFDSTGLYVATSKTKDITYTVDGSVLALNQVGEGTLTNIVAGSTTYTNSKVLVYSDAPVSATTIIQVLKNSTTVLATLTIPNAGRVSNIDLSVFTLVQGDFLGIRITSGDVAQAITLDSTGFLS